MSKVYAVFNEGYYSDGYLEYYDGWRRDWSKLVGIFEKAKDAIEYIDNYDLYDVDEHIQYYLNAFEDGWHDLANVIRQTRTLVGDPCMYGRAVCYNEDCCYVYLSIVTREYELQ